MTEDKTNGNAPSVAGEESGQAGADAWRAARSRLAAVRESLAQEMAFTPQEKEQILKQRARVLAREPEREAEAAAYLEVIAFRLGDETYAIESSYVREVRPLVELTSIPLTPPHVLGIVSVRGQILSVIDLKKLLDLPVEGMADQNRVIVLESSEMVFGVLAEVMLGMQVVLQDDVHPALPTFAGTQEKYLKGVTTDRTVILDAEKLLSDPDIIVYDEVEG